MISLVSVREVSHPEHAGLTETELTWERPRWFRKPATETARGSGTVWHYYPGGRRCGTLLEAEIVDALLAWRWAERLGQR